MPRKGRAAGLLYFKDGLLDGRINVDHDTFDWDRICAGTLTPARAAASAARENHEQLEGTAIWDNAVEEADGDVGIRDYLLAQYTAGFREGCLANIEASRAAMCRQDDD